MADDDPTQLASGMKIQIDYTQLKTAADNMDQLKDHLDATLSAFKSNITDSHMEGTTIYGGDFSGSGNAHLDEKLYDFYNQFTDIAGDAKTKLGNLSQTFRTVALQFLDNDLGVAASVNYQNYQYLLNAWIGKEAAFQHYQRTKDDETTFITYDENGNPVTNHIPMWGPGSPVPQDPGAVPMTYTNTADFNNSLFGLNVLTDGDKAPFPNLLSDAKAFDASAVSMTTTTKTMDHGVLDANSGPNPPDNPQNPVTQEDTTVTYDGGTYTESTTLYPDHPFNYTSHITHADGTTETSSCAANPDGSNALWTSDTKNTDGSTSSYKWTGDASKPGDRHRVNVPDPKDKGDGQGTGGVPRGTGGGGHALI